MQDSILDALPAHIALIDSEGVILGVNASWRRFADANMLLTSNCGVGENYIEVCERAEGDCSEEAARAAVGIGDVLSGAISEFMLEYPCHSPDEQRWFRLMVTPLRDGAGAVVMHFDVTERKLAEDALRCSEQRYRELVEMSHDLIWAVDAEGHFTFLNQAARNIYGRAPEELIGRRFLEFSPAEQYSKDPASLIETMKSGRDVLDYETLVTRADGSIVTVHANLRVLRNPAGQIIGFSGSSRDISARKQYENALQMQAQMLDSIGQAVIATDINGVITYANRFAGELYGWNRQEMLGRNIRDVVVPESGLEMASEVLAKLKRGESWNGEFIVRHREGRVFTILVTNSPLFDANGNHTGIIGISNDITDRKRIEEEATLQANRLAAIVDVQQTLAASESEVDQLTQAVVEMIQLLIGADGAAFGMLEGNEIVYRAASGIASPQLGLRLNPDASFSGSAININQALRCDDAETDERVDRAACREVGLRSMAVAPIRSESGAIGMVKVLDRRPNRFTDLDVKTIEILADSLGAAIQRRRNAERLRASEAQYRLLFADNPQPMWVYDRETLGFLAVNAAAVEHYGYTEAEFLTMTLRDIRPQQDVAQLERHMRNRPEKANNSGRWLHRKKDGSVIEVEITSEAINFSGRNARIVLASDVTQRMRAEREAARANRALEVLSRSNDAMIRAENESELLDLICSIAVETGGFRMACVAYALDDEKKTIAPQAFAGVEDGYFSEIRLTWDETKPEGRGPAGLAVRTGQTVSLPDFSRDERFIYWLAAARKRGYGGIVSLPLIHADRAFGVLLLYLAEVREVLPDELELLKELSDNLAFGVISLRERAERRRTQEAVLAMARGVSAGTGAEFFESLIRSMVESLGARAGYISQNISADAKTARTICGIVSGNLVPNFEYSIPGTPCETLDEEEIAIVRRRARELYPLSPLMGELGVEAYAGIRLNSAAGETVGSLFVLFDEPLREPDFVASMLKIFASRAASEIERQKSDEKLRQQASLLDKAQDAILVRTLDHTITYWNKSAERLYGWTQEEALGRSMRDLLYRHPEDFDQAMQRLLEHGDWAGEVLLADKNGRELIVEASWTLLRDEDGQPRSVLAINTDITERKKLEEQFLRAQRLESIGTLAGGIAHDLNNALAPITMAIELLKMEETDSSRLAILSTIEASAQRGADMVRQVLSFARGVEGRRIEVQVRHLIKDVEKIANETFLKNIQITTSVPRNLWTITGDPTQLHQVLINLCVNARDAMPHGGELKISAENILIDEQFAGLLPDAAPGPHVRIQVEDTGSGMPPEVLDRIFEPFFTTKEVGKGTGLGLPTSLAIVKSHGGFLRVYSERGKGSRFTIHLPALCTTTTSEHYVDAAELPRGAGELILVIDDEPSVRRITRRTLESFGYRVVLAADGAEAVSIYAARRDEIAAVLTDMMMPGMDGATTIQVLVNINPDVRVIAASGLGSNEMAARAAGRGVKDFLPKPYTAETLLKTLRSVINADH